MKILPVILLVLAVATAIPAWFMSTEREAPPELADQYFGIELDVDDDAEIKSLADQIGKVRIVTWESDQPQEILVELADDRWVIRSRYDYPADGEKRLGETAGRVIGVRKLRQITADETSHQELGVVDPLDESAGDEGRGQRATLWSVQGEEVVDLIIGGVVDGQPGQRYAREAGSPEVYTAEISGSLSSRFIDWVQPNPFDLEADHVRSLLVEDYSVDEVRGAVEIRSKTAFERGGKDQDWACLQAPEGKQVAESKVDAIATKVAGLRLANVARRMGLGSQELMARGIFATQDGVYGNEGVLRVATELGYTYHLFFGEVVGSVTEGDDEPTGAEDNDRILATFVTYDPELDTALAPVPPAPAAPAADADEGATTAFEQAKEERAEAQAAHASHVAERNATVERLNARYQAYFYIIRDADFKALRPNLEQLFEDPPAEGEDAADE